MPKPPTLTDEQRRQALAKAASVRRRRAEIRAQLKAGDLAMRELLDLAQADEAIATMRVLAVLESLPRVGKVGARRTLNRLGIAESRKIHGLGLRQREGLLSFGDC
ncbi:MAG: integration host factor, actinobacterial type [Actinobacteria bacterium]|nr:integration host factor, actinobacterial type [Actinomycetota bacterium]